MCQEKSGQKDSNRQFTNEIQLNVHIHQHNQRISKIFIQRKQNHYLRKVSAQQQYYSQQSEHGKNPSVQ